MMFDATTEEGIEVVRRIEHEHKTHIGKMLGIEDSSGRDVKRDHIEGYKLVCQRHMSFK